MTASALDGVPGLGQSRRKALLKHFGSLKRVRAASADEIAAVPGVGPRTAAAVVAALASGDGAPSGVDMATGEILDDMATGEILDDGVADRPDRRTTGGTPA